MTTGAVVWAVLAGAWILWLVTSSAIGSFPSIVRVVRAFLGSWLGRFVAIAAWAGAGWHIFCQRP